jgi:competence protein ComEC
VKKRREGAPSTIRYDEDQLGVKYPLVAPLAALSGGIVVAQFAAFSRWETLLSILLLALLSLLGLAREGLRAGAAACLACFFAVGILVASRPAQDDAHSIRQILAEHGENTDDPVRLRGSVRVPPENLEDADRFVLEMESVYRGRPVRGGVRMTVYRDPESPPLALEYGQSVEFLARLRPPRNFENPGSFDWVNYLAKQDVEALADVREGVPILEAGPNRGHRWMSWLWAARVGASKRLQSLLPETDGVPSTSATILRALLLGESTALDRDTRTRFQRTGTYHALVVSGLHVGVLAFGILWILRLAMIPALPRALLATGAVGAYVWLAGGDVPVARAGWMFAAYLAAAFIYRQRRALNILALAALGFLITMPELLFDAGFQLSFVSVGLIAGIAVPILEATLDPRRRALTDIWNRDLDLHLDPRIAHHRVALRNWLEPLPAATGLPRPVVTVAAIGSLRSLVWIGELLVVSFVIQVGLALLMVVHFQRFSWGGLSANVPVLPLTLIAVPAGLAGLATGWAWLLEIAMWAAGAMNAVVEWHERYLPMDIRVPPPPLWLGWFFGLCLVWIAVSWERGRGRAAASLAFALSLALVVAHRFRPQLSRGRLELCALDVGLGVFLFLALP